MNVLLAALALSTLAQTASSQARPAVVFDMDAEVIEGAVLTVPDVPVVRTAPRHRHESLIRVRASFAREMLASASRI